MTRSAIEVLQELVRGTMEFNVYMQSMTTLKVGGPADIVLYPADRADLSAIVNFLKSREIGFQTVGRGSTLVVKDGGIRGAVLSLTKGFCNYSASADWDGAPLVTAEAGSGLDDFVDYCAESGFGGLEFLAGIPGTVGGALQKNAGGWGRTVGDCVEEVEFLDTEGNILKLPASEIVFGDGAAKLPEGAVILSVTFRSQPKDPGFVASMAQDFRKRRAANYPSPQGAMGPVFKNPMGKPVDKMIDLCGLKGVRVGDAEVSRLNPNYILNLGSAEAANVVSLIGLVQERVYVKFKVKIEPAALILGSWQKDKMRIKE